MTVAKVTGGGRVVCDTVFASTWGAAAAATWH